MIMKTFDIDSHPSLQSAIYSHGIGVEVYEEIDSLANDLTLLLNLDGVYERNSTLQIYEAARIAHFVGRLLYDAAALRLLPFYRQL